MTIHADPDGFEVLALDALLPDFSGRRVLEVGCGDGRLTRRFASRAASVLAIDPDKAAIAAARRDVPAGRVDFRVGSFVADEPVLPDRAFDVVILSWSL